MRDYKIEFEKRVAFVKSVKKSPLDRCDRVIGVS